jgi:hypothetical protein
MNETRRHPMDAIREEAKAKHKKAKTPNGKAPPSGESPKAETFLAKASEIAPEPIAWLWKYWLARGKLHIIAGAPGGGKTTVYLSFAAIVSAGATWPDGTRAKVGNVLIWTSEDGHADTIIPRLMRMGADLEHIFIVRSHREATGKTRAFNPSTDMESLREKAATISGGVDFVFLDPVVSAVPITRNSQECRGARRPNALCGFCNRAERGGRRRDPCKQMDERQRPARARDRNARLWRRPAHCLAHIGQ